MRPRLLGLTMLTVVAAGCGGRAVAPSKPAPAVTTAPATVRRVRVTLAFLGRAEAARTVRLVARAEGRIVRVEARDGAAVRAGQPVFEVGGPRVAAQLEALGAAVEGASNEAAAAGRRLAQAKRRRQAHLAAPGELAAAEAATAAARMRLAAARSALKRLKTALDVGAPVAGYFVDRRVSTGQSVAPGDVLGTILEPGSIRISADVLPRPGLTARVGQTAEVEVEDGPPLRARVEAMQPTPGVAGTVRVWLTGRALRGLEAGTAVRGRIIVAVHEHAVTVPASAVVRDRHGRALVYAGSKAPFERRPVTTGETGPGWIEITSGLRAGEPIVTKGAYELYWATFAKEFKAED